MHAPSAPRGYPHVMDWCAGFDRYLRSGDERDSRIRLSPTHARRFTSLASSQRRPRLLHGDLQHYNILFDTNRGWLAIDPKGVVGEVEYEIGAVLRNPAESPDLFASGGNRRAAGQSTGRTAGYRSRTYRSSGDTFKPCCQQSGPSKMGTRSLRTALCSGWPTSSAR